MITNRTALSFAAALALLLIGAPCFAADDVDTAGALYAGTPEDAERLLLVWYDGQGARRVHSGARVNMYRQRGSYATNSYGRRIAKKVAERYGLEHLVDWPITEVSIHCAVYLVPEGPTMEAKIAEIQADDRVTFVQRMATYQTMTHTYSDPYFELQASAKHFNLAEAHAMATGRDITVAMIDTGVAVDHPDLEGQIIATENLVQRISPDFSGDAHGTAVAGIIAAKGNNGAGIVGVAPESELIALKACWPTASGAFESRCNSFTLALALNSAIRMGASVLNMSLAGPPDPVIELLIREAVSRNIAVVAAIPPGGDVNEAFPASMPEVIAVRSQDALADVLGEKLDGGFPCISAPGEEIITTLPNGRYDFLSGSSLAAAQISGYIALIKQMYPNISIGQIRRHLEVGIDDLRLDQVMSVEQRMHATYTTH